MREQKLNKTAEARRKYLLDNTGIDRIIETCDVVRDFTDFITTQGGDVVKYRVYGTSDKDFALYEK